MKPSLEAVSVAYEGDIQMMNCPSIRVHQHAANGKTGRSIAAPSGLRGNLDTS
jgi:hypothetical protein